MDKRLRLRKFSPLDRIYPIYEVILEGEVLVDVGRGDNGRYEIAFHPQAPGKVISLDELQELIAEAKELLADE